MRIKSITVMYSQTCAGVRQYEGEKFEIVISADTETEDEQNPRKIGIFGGKLFDKAIEAVEKKSGRKMRRFEPKKES